MRKNFNSWFNKKSLHFKLNVSILSCVSFVFLFLIVYISIRAKPLIYEQTENLAKKSLEAYAFDLSHLVKDTEQSVINIKNTLSHFQEQDIASIQVTLNSAIQTVYHSELNYTNAWVYTFNPEDVSKGNLYISHNTDNNNDDFQTKKITNFYEHFSWFTDVPKIDKIYWSEPYIDKTSNLMVVTCIIPFKFIGETDYNGIAALTMNLTDIKTSISSYSFYETGKLLLLSRSGLYITHPDPSVELKTTVYDLSKKLNLPNLSMAGNDVMSGKSGKFEVPYSSIYDSPTIYFYTPIKSIKWGMFLVYEKNAFLTPIFKFQFLIFISLLIGVILISIFVNFICKHSTHQILKLGKIASQYGNGKFTNDFTEEPYSKDIGILSKALADMKTDLLEYIEKEKNDAVEKQKSVSEIEIAYQIQQAALSTRYPNHQAFDMSTLMIPAKQIGGDFYDFFFIDDNKFAIVIADVSGKGIPAALYMMKSQALIKTIAKSKIPLTDVFYRVNNELYEGNDNCMFVSAFIAIIDLVTGKTEYVNAGHNPPLMIQKTNYEYILPRKNIVLGIKKNATYVSETVTLNSNNRILLYTDGVTEAENIHSKFYGTDRLRKVLKNVSVNASENLNMILNDLKKFGKGAAQSDDITLLEFIYKGYSSSLKTNANIKNIEEIISFFKKDMLKYNIKEDEIQFKAIMIAEEVFSNIAQYAYKKPNIGKLQIDTQVINNEYVITFRDNGKEYNLINRNNPDISVDIKDREIGGLGIYIIKKLADNISYERIDNTNILKVFIKLQ